MSSANLEGKIPSGHHVIALVLTWRNPDTAFLTNYAHAGLAVVTVLVLPSVAVRPIKSVIDAQ